jgi:hypothetical protein
MDEGVYVSLRGTADSTAPPLRFRVAVDTFDGEKKGNAVGTLVGRARPGGNLVLEAEHGLVWPTSPPMLVGRK